MTTNALWDLPIAALFNSRNIFLDNLFYDITTLSPPDLECLVDILSLEGAVVVASPRRTCKRIRCYANAADMLKMECTTLHGVVVSGLGSSIVGAAALAQNVADAYDVDVAGVVSGSDLAEVMTETIDGQYFYQYIDQIHHHIAIVMAEMSQAFCIEAQNCLALPHQKMPAQWDASISWRRESGTLLDILVARPPNLQILIGHSKGAVLVDYVLDKLVQRMAGTDHPYYDQLQIVTVGALVALPKEFANTSQIIGQFDWLGGINSQPDLLWEKNAATKPKYVKNAWHHLNNKLPFSLDLAEALNTHVAPRHRARPLERPRMRALRKKTHALA